MALTTAQAQSAIEAGFAKATELGIAFTIAVLDDGANLIAQVKGDGAALASLGTSYAKAVTAVHFGQPTEGLQAAVAPGAPLYGIGSRDATYAFVAGGVPVLDAASHLIGAIGVGGGSPADDHQVALAASAAIV